MKKQEFIKVIDEAAKMCGGQNALARKIGVTSSNMSQYRMGKRAVPNEVIRKIADVVDKNPADVWLLAQDARNPFINEEPEEKVNFRSSAPVTRGKIVLRALVSGRKILTSIILGSWLKTNA